MEFIEAEQFRREANDNIKFFPGELVAMLSEEKKRVFTLRILVMKLPNNYGSIYKKGGNRRKPYAVVVTTGWTDEGKQKRKGLGYVTSPAQGLKLLAEYYNNPYNLNIKNISFSDIWKDVEVELEKMVEQGTMSSSNLDSLKFAFYNYCQSIHNEKC